MRAVLTQHSFHCCVDRGDEGVLLERDINLHVDVEGEIVRGWIHVHRKYTCSRAYLDLPPPPPPPVDPFPLLKAKRTGVARWQLSVGWAF